MIELFFVAGASVVLVALDFWFTKRLANDYQVERAQIEIEFGNYDENVRRAVLWFRVRNALHHPTDIDFSYEKVLRCALGDQEAQKITGNFVR